MKNFSNDVLLETFGQHIPQQPGTQSPVIFVAADTSSAGTWGLFVTFEKVTKKINHALKGMVEQTSVVVHRAMANLSAETLVDLPDPGSLLPNEIGLFRDFKFIAADEAYPDSRSNIESGYQPFVNQNGQGAFNAEGKLLVLNEFVCLKTAAGKVGDFPTDRLTSVRPIESPILSKRERLFAAYRQSFGVAVSAPAHIF